MKIDINEIKVQKKNEKLCLISKCILIFVGIVPSSIYLPK